MPGFYNDGTPKSTIMFTDNMDFTGNFGNPTANFVAAGQLPIGTGVLSPLGPQILVNTLTAGTGINIVNGAGTITISALTAGFVWLDVSGGFGAQKETGYFIIGTSTATLPAVPSQGDTIQFFVDHATQVLTLQAGAGQIIRMGSLASSVAGTWVSTLQGDSCELVFRSVDNCWCAVDFVGTWTKT